MNILGDQQTCLQANFRRNSSCMSAFPFHIFLIVEDLTAANRPTIRWHNRVAVGRHDFVTHRRSFDATRASAWASSLGWLTIHEELHVIATNRLAEVRPLQKGQAPWPFNGLCSFLGLSSAEGLKEQSGQEVSFLLRFAFKSTLVGRPRLLISRASKRLDRGAIFAPPGASLTLVIHQHQLFCTR